MNLRLSQAQACLLHPVERYGLRQVTKELFHVVDRWKFEETRESFSRFHNPLNVTHRALQKNLRAVR